MKQQQAIRNEAEQVASRRACESTVSTAFVSFLQAITDLVSQSRRQWTAGRLRLRADFSTQRWGKQFVACTDGQLEETSSRRILALIECKQWRRQYHPPAVDMQEAAQMIA